MRRAETVHVVLIWDATRRVAEIAACLLVSMFMLEKLYILHLTSSSILLLNYGTSFVPAQISGAYSVTWSFISLEDRNVVLGGDRARPKRRKERIQRT